MPRVSARAEFNDHHIVPKQLYENPKTASQREVSSFLQDAGYSRAALNESTVRLPTGRSGFERRDSSSIHRGSHPEYTQQVENKLDKLSYISEKYEWSQQQTCEAVTSVMDSYQSQLESGSMSLNNAVDHRIADEQAYQQAQDQRAYNEQCYQQEEALRGVKISCARTDGLPDLDSYTLHLPCDPEFVDQIMPNLEQFLYELNTLTTIKKEMPYLDLPKDLHEEIEVSTSLHDTLVGHSFLEADYFMKAFIHQAIFFKTKDAEKGFAVAKECRSRKRKELYAYAFKAEGAIDLRKLDFYKDATSEFLKLFDSIDSKYLEFNPDLKSVPGESGMCIHSHTWGVELDMLGNFASYSRLIFNNHKKMTVTKEAWDKYPNPDEEYSPTKEFSVYIQDSMHPSIASLKDNLAKGDKKIAYHLNVINVAHGITNFLHSLSVHDRVPEPPSFLQQVEATARKLPPLVVGNSNVIGAKRESMYGGVHYSMDTIQPTIVEDGSFTTDERPNWNMVAFKVHTRKVDTLAKMDDWKRAMSSVPVILVPSAPVFKKEPNQNISSSKLKYLAEIQKQKESIVSEAVPVSTPKPRPKPVPKPKPKPKPKPTIAPKPAPKPKKKGLFSCCGRPD